jgi:hypothetical protein
MLAVTQAHGLIPLAEVLAAEALRFSRNTTVIIVTPAIDPEWVAATRHLIDRGVRTTAIVIDPGSFGMPYNALETEIELTASYVPHYIVRQDDPLDQALANARSTR